MSDTERERLLATLQHTVNAALALLGLPKDAWGDVTVRLENGRVALPVETRLTFK